MPELATREFWEGLQPIPDCFKPDTRPEVCLRNMPTEGERLCVPSTETVRSRPLWISLGENRWCDTLMATSAGLVSRRYHLREVFAYTISGKWGYLEYDWTVTTDNFVYGTSDEGHTLMAYKHKQSMRALFIVKGSLVWLNEKGDAGDVFGVRDCIAMCRAHYDKVGIGAVYIDSLFRWP